MLKYLVNIKILNIFKQKIIKIINLIENPILSIKLLHKVLKNFFLKNYIEKKSKNFFIKNNLIEYFKTNNPKEIEIN